MKRYWILIISQLILLQASGSDGPPKRGHPADRVFFQVNWAATFYQAPKEIQEGYSGMSYVPFLGYEAGIGMMFPFQFKQNGRYFHYATDMVGGINPISVNLDVVGSTFNVDIDDFEKIRFNNSYFTVRQTLYWYNRASDNRIRKNGIGLGARSVRKNEFSWTFNDPLGENLVRADYLLDSKKEDKNWVGELDIQIVKGWQWVFSEGGFLGFDVFVNFNFGESTVYRYDIYSQFNILQGKFEINSNFIGIRFVTGLTNSEKKTINDIQFPN